MRRICISLLAAAVCAAAVVAQAGSPGDPSTDAKKEWDYADYGIFMNKQTVKDVKFFKKSRDRVQDLYWDADAVEEALANRGDYDRAKQIRALKQTLRTIKGQMPKYEMKPSFLKEMRAYKYERLKQHRIQLQEMEKKLADLGKELNVKMGGAPKRKSESGVRSLPGGGSTSGGGNGGGDGGGSTTQEKTPFEIYVGAMSGDVYFYINGKKVEYAGQSFPCGKDPVVKLRAMLVGPRRRQSLEFKPTDHTVTWENNEYKLSYTVSTGNFEGTTTWEVEHESYDWYVNCNRVEGEWEVARSERYPKIKFIEDILKLNGKGAMTFDIEVQGKVKWDPVKVGRGFLSTDTDEGKGKIKISLAPK